jgi:putative transcriptional regulator
MTKGRAFSLNRPSSRAKPYHYRACGLDDVYLLSGFTLKETAYGPAISIKDIEGLHNAIASALVTQRAPLSEKEFRFLRKRCDLTQQDLAKRLRVDVQTVARYEKGQTTISGAADFILRLLFSMRQKPSNSRYRLVEAALEILDESSSRRGAKTSLHMEGSRSGWKSRELVHS